MSGESGFNQLSYEADITQKPEYVHGKIMHPFSREDEKNVAYDTIHRCEDIRSSKCGFREVVFLWTKAPKDHRLAEKRATENKSNKHSASL